uniref:NECAP PHear domain-containing protein n=1 Tax=Nomascus leucogenys TaxID=61853 RepID=A0A2I3I029_NOMLE
MFRLEYESVLCVKPDISVYWIPPWVSNCGYTASDWKLDQPDWSGRLRIISKGKTAYIKLEDKVSGKLFTQTPVEQYPGIAVETDSSCYFLIWIQDGAGHSAVIDTAGFTDRGDAFDFNVSLQDHFRWVKQESEISKESQEMDACPNLDLGFKEGQTIKLSASKPRTAMGGGLSLLPSPPGGKVTIPPLNHVTPPPIPKSNHGGTLHPALFQTRHHSHPTGSSAEWHWKDIKDRLRNKNDLEGQCLFEEERSNICKICLIF